MEPVVRAALERFLDLMACPYCPISDPAVKVIVEDDLVRFAQNERVQVALSCLTPSRGARFRLSTWSTRCSPASSDEWGAARLHRRLTARDARLAAEAADRAIRSGQAVGPSQGCRSRSRTRRSGGERHHGRVEKCERSASLP